MIAVSSNTHKILVFAFALDSKSPLMTRQETEFFKCDNTGYPFTLGDTFRSDQIDPLQTRDPGVHRTDHPAMPSIIDRRHHNVVICLAENGHETNIPSIAFWNPDPALQQRINGEDNSHIFLASIDINGTVLIWNVWMAQRILMLRADDLKAEWRDGWSIACLDPNFSLAAHDTKTCFGTSRTLGHPDEQVVDNSACIDTVKDNATSHPDFLKLSSIPFDQLPASTANALLTGTSGDPENLPGPGSVGSLGPVYDFGINGTAEEDDEFSSECHFMTAPTCQITHFLELARKPRGTICLTK